VSRQEQIRFLEDLHEKLYKQSENYRTARADRQVHLFTVNVGGIRRGIVDRLKKEGASASQVQAIINALLPDLMSVVDNTKTNADGSKTKAVKIKIISYIKGNVLKAVFTYTDARAGTRIYNYVYESYIGELEALASKITLEAKKFNIESDFKARKYWNLSHAIEAGIVESEVRDAIIDSTRNSEDISLRDVQQYIDDSPLTLGLVRDSATDTMQVSVDSAVKNKLDGTESRDKRKRLKELIEKDLAFLLSTSNMQTRLLNLPGSDSFKEVKRKKLIKNVVEEFAKIDGVRVTTENIKINTSKVRIESSKEVKTRKNSASKKTIKKGRTRKIKTGENSPIRLMALINAKLPQTVAKNMGAPRLENRTGTFASSVRVTEVTQTAKGFPSVGYTYEKQPYGVFERTSGTRFASVDRDPRDLIDLSIREIAQQMAIGRFYTRRV